MLWHNWQVRIVRRFAPSPGYISVWANPQRNSCLHRLLWRGVSEQECQGSWLPLQGDPILNDHFDPQACSCDVELATCIAATGHCAPSILGIADQWGMFSFSWSLGLGFVDKRNKRLNWLACKSKLFYVFVDMQLQIQNTRTAQKRIRAICNYIV